MTSDPFARSRLRKVLVAVILATIPCYCAGLVAVLLAPGRSQQSSTTPTIAASWTPVVFATQTSTYTFTPGIPTSTFTPSQTPTITTTPTITLTPTITQTPTASTSPTPTNTAFIPPTFTKTPPFTVTYTITPTPTSTRTPLPTNTNTPLPTATDTPTPDLSLTVIPTFILMLNGIP